MNLIAFDVETYSTVPAYGLQPWRDDFRIRSFAWSDASAAKVIRDPSINDLRQFLRDCVDTSRYIVGWNTAFDISCLCHYGLQDDVLACNWLDGSLLWRHLTVTPQYDVTSNKRKSYGLKAAVAEFFPTYAGYEEGIDYFTLDEAEIQKLLRYNALDAVFTYQLATLFWSQLSSQQQIAALIEAQSLPLVGIANHRGLHIDVPYTLILQETLAQTIKDKLVETGLTQTVLNSPVQLREILFNQWDLVPPRATPKGAASTDKDTLSLLADVDTRAKAIHEYREAVGNKTKFVDNILESTTYSQTAYTHPTASLFSTYTGRMTYASKQGRNKAAVQTGFAIHQTKRSPVYRRVLIPPDGFTLIEYDAAGQEYRFMALQSQDETMLTMCQPGEDGHAYMGARIGGVPYARLRQAAAAGDPQAKEARQLGKVANLSLQYRTSARRLRDVARTSYGVLLTEQQAVLAHQTYRETYIGVPQYWRSAISTARSRGYAETLAGRRVHLPRVWARSLAWSLESTAINYPIQGTGADQKYLALAVLKNSMRQDGVYFYFELHDGIILIMPTNKVDTLCRKYKKLLDTLPYKAAWGHDFEIPLPWDCKIGRSFGELMALSE